MAKLTKAQTAELARALDALERVSKFIHGDNIAVCRRDTVATTTMHFTRNPLPDVLQNSESRRLGNYALMEITKDIGSDLCLLQNAKKHLQALLA
jgi:hypothetical protein